MARRKKSGRARAFARKTRTVYRSAKKGARRAYSRGRSSGWLPLSGRDMMVTAAAGAATPLANQYVGRYLSPFTGFAGEYQDELNTAIVGLAAHKLGSGFVKDMGREMVRGSVYVVGAQLGNKFTGTSAGSSGGYL